MSNWGVSGIKQLMGNGINGYKFELKIAGERGGYRLLGNLEKVTLKGGKEIETVVFRDVIKK